MSGVEKRFGAAIRIIRGLSGESVTTFALGGPLAGVVEPVQCAALSELYRALNDEQPYTPVLGNGSNLLIPDSGVDCLVLRLGRSFSGWLPTGDDPASVDEAVKRPDTEALLREIPLEIGAQNSFSLIVYGSTPLMALSRVLANAAYSGLEFACGIPGSIGGAVRVNAGAHGRSIGELVRAVFCVDKRGQCLRFLPGDLSFSYRNSGIPDTALIFAVQMCFERGDLDQIASLRSSFLEYRKNTQPLQLPSAGSVFRNPTLGVQSGRPEGERVPSAGELLERAGLKGFRRGGAGFSEIHANWIVKLNHSARSSDVLALIELARERVLVQFSTELQTELVIW